MLTPLIILPCLIGITLLITAAAFWINDKFDTAIRLFCIGIALIGFGMIRSNKRSDEFKRRGLTEIVFQQKKYIVKHATAADVRELLANIENRISKEDSENDF